MTGEPAASFEDFSRLVFEWRTSRQSRSLSRDAFGRMVGVSGDSVRRWEKGVQRPGPGTCEEVARVLGIPATDVLTAAGYPVPGLGPSGCPVTDTASDDARDCRSSDSTWVDGSWTPRPILESLSLVAEGPMERRSFLALTGGSLAGPILPWMLEPAPLAGHDGTFRVGLADADRIDSMVDNLRRASDTRGGPAMLASIRGFLGYVVDHLRNGTYSEAVERRLYNSASQLARLAGWVTFVDNRDTDTAYRWCLVSLQAAHVANAPTVGASTLGMLASIEILTGGSPREAVTIVEAARQRSASAITPRGAAALGSVAAQAYGMAGDTRKVEQESEDAFANLDGVCPEEEPAHLYYFDEQELRGTVGDAFRLAGDNRRAREHLTRGLELPAMQPRYRAVYQFRLAATLVADGDLEQACAVASDALASIERDDAPQHIVSNAAEFATTLRTQPSCGASADFLDHFTTAARRTSAG